jgi:hypothetical protein
MESAALTTVIVAVVVASGPMALAWINNRIARENARKLDTVHSLVNSTLTTAIKGELHAMEWVLAQMHDPTAGTPRAISQTESRIVDLKIQLNDRTK